jgi:2-iminobutanoate/2-iminopropanoate deaminase
MDRMIVSTENAPLATGSYSQAVVVGDFVFTAGTLPLHPQTGEVVGEDITSQTRQVLKNLASILEAAGSSLEKVVKTTVFLTDKGNQPAMNSTYGEFFGASPPARSTVQVGPLTKGSLIEIEAIAVR